MFLTPSSPYLAPSPNVHRSPSGDQHDLQLPEVLWLPAVISRSVPHCRNPQRARSRSRICAEFWPGFDMAKNSSSGYLELGAAPVVEAHSKARRDLAWGWARSQDLRIGGARFAEISAEMLVRSGGNQGWYLKRRISIFPYKEGHFSSQSKGVIRRYRILFFGTLHALHTPHCL